MYQTHELIELIEAMASAKIIQRLETKIDEVNNTVNTKYTVLIWVIGFASLVISAAIIFGG